VGCVEGEERSHVRNGSTVTISRAWRENWKPGWCDLPSVLEYDIMYVGRQLYFSWFWLATFLPTCLYNSATTS